MKRAKLAILASLALVSASLTLAGLNVLAVVISPVASIAVAGGMLVVFLPVVFGGHDG